ncbi:amidase [Alicyclobacillus dauci]|uniref:Amidase n=1 Tax=Alicyclobacillus dauci TaxID=1475485 RepID=A0ABY6Z6Z6_9BACL|nr:amidase [Alicyclobacillus dauci]WAH38659.1 amidase [Alicyclobacillus dauci]
MQLATLAQHIRDKEISPVEVTHDVLKRIHSLNPILNAYGTVLEEQALEDAKAAEREIMSGVYRGPLHGVPIGLKDLIFTKGIRTTMGSKVYANFVPEENATVVERIRDAGGIVLGKLNMDEFAYGSTGDKSYFGPVKNPFNISKISGGSSSGAGAAVVSELCYGAIGTDTGGSIRIPSSCCGIIGLKPTFGRVSKFGVYPLSYTLDHVGPMTRFVKDNAIVLGIIAGCDKKDPYSYAEFEDFTRLMNDSIKGATIGVPSNFFFEQIDSQVAKALQHTISVFQDLGANIRSVTIPQIQTMSWGQVMIQTSETYAIHESTLQTHATDLDVEIKQQLLTCASTRGYDYVKATQQKDQTTVEINQIFDEVDILLTPTVPILPTDTNQREIQIGNVTYKVNTTLLRFTLPWSYTGNPCLSIPCGFSEDGLPIGMQLVGRTNEEAQLYRFGYWFEQTSGVLDEREALLAHVFQTQ